MRSFMMEVNTKVDGKYSPVGKVEVFYPLLSELGIFVDPAKYVGTDKDGKEVDSTADDAASFPVYADEKVQYAFDAVFAAVKAQARNRLQPNTANLKEGLTIAETVEELLDSGAGNKGEALANIREAVKAFGTWIKTTGKSEKLATVLVSLFAAPKAVITAAEKRVAQLETALAEFVSVLPAEQAAKFGRHLVKLEESINLNRSMADED